MSPILAILSACMLLSSSFAASSKHPYITEVKKLTDVTTKVGADDACSVCVEFSTQALHALIQMVLQVGVLDSCGDLCQVLADKVDVPAIGFVCSVLCDVVGVDEFVKIINKEDLNPIYFCEEVKACGINDNGDAKFTTFDVSPKSGPQGIFQISFEYVSQNGTGTGQLVLDIDTVDKLALGEAFLHEIAPAGTYDGSFQLKAEVDPDCDPTQGPCEQWLPGDYTVKIAICNGECGSKHPHSQLYDEATATFTITDN